MSHELIYHGIYALQRGELAAQGITLQMAATCAQARAPIPRGGPPQFLMSAGGDEFRAGDVSAPFPIGGTGGGHLRRDAEAKSIAMQHVVKEGRAPVTDVAFK